MWRSYSLQAELLLQDVYASDRWVMTLCLKAKAFLALMLYSTRTCKGRPWHVYGTVSAPTQRKEAALIQSITAKHDAAH